MSEGGAHESSSDRLDMKLLLERLTATEELEYYLKAARMRPWAFPEMGG